MFSKGTSVLTFEDYETMSSLQTFSRNCMWLIGKFEVRKFDLFQTQLTDPSRERNALGYKSPDSSLEDLNSPQGLFLEREALTFDLCKGEVVLSIPIATWPCSIGAAGKAQGLY